MRGRQIGAAWALVAAVALAIAFLAMGASAKAQTLEQALTAAYVNNPTLNAQRAALRAADENVPKALSGYRPTITGAASVARTALTTSTDPQIFPCTGGPPCPITIPASRFNSILNQSTLSLNVTQNVYNGFRTANNVRAAEAQVRQSQEVLRSTEQQILLDAVTAHMNVLRDEALVQLQQQNLKSLGEQLRAAKDRFEVGEVTRTDTALAEAAEAGGRSSLIQAQSNLATSRGVYRQVIGAEAGKLSAGRPVEQLLPRSYDLAIADGLQRNPDIISAQYAIDYASLQVKVVEGALLPSVNVQGTLQRSNEPTTQIKRQDEASIGLSATAPIYQGGAEYAAIRQAKEVLGQTRIQMDVTRDQVRALIVQFWSQLEAARSEIAAAQTQVNAQGIALKGINDEYRVGQRTISDVLLAQANLVQAQSTLVNAQRDRVVASYAVLGAIGRLDMNSLGLQVATYDPEEHYRQVRDSWGGLRTPDGR
ncbi:MAG TPA: TolC family outer membrane protein [Xanthobacteraceae bacterium]|nr:TolC family outer membrane protein [Xanthobacteraceae bacterium]